MLDSHDLRQIGQRISLRYQITPAELQGNPGVHPVPAQHRLPEAHAALRPRAPYRHIYAHSRGIPRLINIACDRALLTAFGMNRHAGDGPDRRQAPCRK
ncbi:MAG: hypothetical protein MZU91_07325 [Desulfosudis oleivorans]|nr:hypothetical protein [Desulfosudis oleivorans]